MLSTGRMHDTFRRTDQLENRVAQLFNFRLVNPEFLFESKTWEITFIRQEVTLKWLKINNEKWNWRYIPKETLADLSLTDFRCSLEISLRQLRGWRWHWSWQLDLGWKEEKVKLNRRWWRSTFIRTFFADSNQQWYWPMKMGKRRKICDPLISNQK